MTPVGRAAWYRVSTDHQASANQVPEVMQLDTHPGYEIAAYIAAAADRWR